MPHSSIEELDCEAKAVYVEAVSLLREAAVPFLVGGAFAFERYTGIARYTKDFDIFLRRSDCPRALEVLGRGGFSVALTFPHWLAKAFKGDLFIDLIFGSGNGVAEVDERWFAHAVDAEVFGVPVPLIPAEEMIWSKAFVMERERYDGADVAHLILACGPELDWARLVERFGDEWRVLLAHLLLFGFIYPGERDKVPTSLVNGLLERWRQQVQTPPPDTRVCGGTLISREQYDIDVTRWGFVDARLRPRGRIPRDELAIWMADLERPKSECLIDPKSRVGSAHRRAGGARGDAE
ncbi:MAG: nucleotidyltransferase [Acidobacteria bacterium]|nr:nucleotidyltransferase [Acidobacteriota bacterium]